MTPYEKKPLVNIDKSGTYLLKLIRPKDDQIANRFKLNKNGFASARLFFMDGDGNCLTKNFTAGGKNKETGAVESWGKGLAMLVKNMTGAKWCPTAPADITPENLFRYVEPAFGNVAYFDVEVTPDTPWEGKPQFNYKFKKIEARKIPSADAPPADFSPGVDNPF